MLYTFHENPVRIEGAEGFRVDLATGEGLAALTLAAAPAFVVNLAAVSQPRRCEANPAAAASVNAPTVLAAWQASLDEAHRAKLLVHVSTDQVYGDSKPPPALYVEADPAEPVNAYGRSKLAAERLLADGRAFAGDWVALRSSVIFGPKPPAAPVKRGLFLQWMDSALKGGEEEEEEDGGACGEGRSACGTAEPGWVGLTPPTAPQWRSSRTSGATRSSSWTSAGWWSGSSAERRARAR